MDCESVFFLTSSKEQFSSLRVGRLFCKIENASETVIIKLVFDAFKSTIPN
jgi:hypothetical protein